jgi:pentatricopeptide repeat protein
MSDDKIVKITNLHVVDGKKCPLIEAYFKACKELRVESVFKSMVSSCP